MFKRLSVACLILASTSAFGGNNLAEEAELRDYLINTCGSKVPEFQYFMATGKFGDMGKYAIQHYFIGQKQRFKACPLSLCLKAHDVWFSKYQAKQGDLLSMTKAINYYDKKNVEYRRQTIQALDQVCDSGSDGAERDQRISGNMAKALTQTENRDANQVNPSTASMAAALK